MFAGRDKIKDLVARYLGACLVLFLLCFATPVSAQGLEDVRWQYLQYNDPENGGRSTSRIVIGVPETDLVLGTATCFAGSTAGLPMLELAAGFPGDVPENVGIEFSTEAGPIAFTGFGKRPMSEEDFSGVRIQPDMRDPLWASLQRMNSIRYIVGGVSYDLPLRGSGEAIANLLADCRTYHGDFNPAVELRTDGASEGETGLSLPDQRASDPRWATCDRFNTVRSQRSDTAVTMTFTNASDGYRAVYWIDFTGMPVQYATLNQGEQFTIQTFLTHPWMFTDGPGNCIEMFFPQLGVSAFDIAAPGRYFGPE